MTQVITAANRQDADTELRKRTGSDFASYGISEIRKNEADGTSTYTYQTRKAGKQEGRK